MKPITKKDFTKETINVMKSTLKITKNKELAFALCRRNDKKITYGQPTCIGSYCEVISSESKCKFNEENIGTFHTHPINVKASIEDLINTFDREITCIGSKSLSLLPFQKNIECYYAIDKTKKKDAIKYVGNYNKTCDNLIEHVKQKNINIQDAYSIRKREYDNTTKKLLPLFYRFKI